MIVTAGRYYHAPMPTHLFGCFGNDAVSEEATLKAKVRCCPLLSVDIVMHLRYIFVGYFDNDTASKDATLKRKRGAIRYCRQISLCT